MALAIGSVAIGHLSVQSNTNSCRNRRSTQFLLDAVGETKDFRKNLQPHHATESQVYPPKLVARKLQPLSIYSRHLMPNGLNVDP